MTTAPNQRARLRGLTVHTLRVGAALIVALVLAELTLRIVGFGLPPRGPNNRLPLRRAVSEVEAPGMLEELIPLARGEVLYPGRGDESDRVVEYRINADGLRDRRYPQTRQEGVFRIAVVGDSVTYGTGVKMDETLPKQMERRFAELLAEPRVEVMNCGIYAYNTGQQVAFLEHRILAWQPDLVLICSTITDASGHGAIREIDPEAPEPAESRWIRRLGLTSGVWDPGEDGASGGVERMLFLRRNSVLIDYLAHRAYNHLFARLKQGHFELDWAAGAPGRLLVESSLARAVELSRERGFELHVAMYPTLIALDESHPYLEETDILRGICEGLGVPFHDPMETLGGREATDLHVHAHDRHPNPFTHGLVARQLVNELLVALH